MHESNVVSLPLLADEGRLHEKVDGRPSPSPYALCEEVAKSLILVRLSGELERMTGGDVRRSSEESRGRSS